MRPLPAWEVLEAKKPSQLQTLSWKELIIDVQARVGTKRNGEPYSEATIRKHVRDYVYMILYWPEIPPHLLDRRQPVRERFHAMPWPSKRPQW